MAKKPKPLVKHASFAQATLSFRGHLQGTHKAKNSVKNYGLDIAAFVKFLGARRIELRAVESTVLRAYAVQLEKEGLRVNTRRRRLLTAQKFLRYLHARKRAPAESALKFPTPHKIERIPASISIAEFLERVARLPTGTGLQRRNQLLLRVLGETGCTVAEVGRLRFQDVELRGSAWQIEFPPEPYKARGVEISEGLGRALLEEAGSRRVGLDAWVFEGFNRFGSMGSPMTARGVELLVSSVAAELGYPGLSPRLLRHSRALDWLRARVPESEVQTRLGLASRYAFRAYRAALASGTP